MFRYLATVASSIEKRSFPYLRLIGGISSIILILMMMSTVADALGRRLFGTPIPGTYEFVSYLLCLLFLGSLCFCSIEKNHLSISVFTSILPVSVRTKIVAIGRFISFAICWLMAWRLVISALSEKKIGTHGMQLTFVPLYPFIFIIAIGMVIVGFAFLLEGFQYLGPTEQKRDVNPNG